MGRNTPTGVGKTDDGLGQIDLLPKHPHGRGEDAPVVALVMSRLETPPRAWGRHRKYLESDMETRNTPTGVGKTC